MHNNSLQIKGLHGHGETKASSSRLHVDFIHTAAIHFIDVNSYTYYISSFVSYYIDFQIIDISCFLMCSFVDC